MLCLGILCGRYAILGNVRTTISGKTRYWRIALTLPTVTLKLWSDAKSSSFTCAESLCNVKYKTY